MKTQPSEIIDKYDVLFAARTGVTILVPKSSVFDSGIEIPVEFNISPENPKDLVISGSGRSAILKDLKKDYLDEALSRGFIMFYEMEDDEVVRCTPCQIAPRIS